MSDPQTDRLGLPMLQPGQAQKEMSHNEVLTLLDLAVQAAVEAIGVTAPPVEPAPGQCWIVGSPASGAWAGREDCVAGWTEAGWRFVAPTEGMAAWSRQDAQTARFSDGLWHVGDVRATRLIVAGDQVVGQRRPAIAAPSGGAAPDAEARAAIAAMLEALRSHGLIAV